MEKLEWREAFNRQPVHYLFFDQTKPMSLDILSMICQVLQNVAALSNSLKGSTRFSMLGIYSLSPKGKCVFPLQPVKQSFAKLQFSLESIQSSQALAFENENFNDSALAEILQEVVTQYESYFQSALQNREEWPQLQMTFFSVQSQALASMVRSALSSIHLAYINKVEVIVVRNRSTSAFPESSRLKSSSSSPQEGSLPLFSDDDTDSIISSLLCVTEVDPSAYQLESLLKQWLHDASTDSDHLRLTVGGATLRCDVRESTLTVDALPAVAGQYCLFTDAGAPAHQAVRPSAAGKQASSKVPVHTMDAVAVVPKGGLCESLLFGQSYVASPTRCWKLDWDDLDRNQQLFRAVVGHLSERGLVLLARRRHSPAAASEKVPLPLGVSALFPSRSALLVKSVATGELVLPLEDSSSEKEVAAGFAEEAKECIEMLEKKTLYNPLALSSGLYSYLNSSLSKKQRSSTSFVTPIISNSKGFADEPKRRRTVPMPEVGCTNFPANFMSASNMLKNKFSNGFE